MSQGCNSNGLSDNYYNVNLRRCPTVARFCIPGSGSVLDRCSSGSFLLLRRPAFHVSCSVLSTDTRIMAHEHSIDKLTAVWLLPIVAPIVTAATGGNLCTVLPSDSSNLHSVLVVSYTLWGMGMPFAMSILVLYIYRLTVYKVLGSQNVV